MTANDWECLESCEIQALHRIYDRLGEMLAVETAILDLLAQRFQIVRFRLTQGDNMPVTGKITGLIPGASDTFFATPVDNTGTADVLPAGTPVPTWTANDATVVVTPAADGLSATVAAATTATPGSSFTLTVSTTLSGASAPITGTATVPILTPPQQAPVAFVLGQGAPPA